MGERKKHKAHILKYVPCVLKYVRHVFRLPETGLQTAPGEADKKGAVRRRLPGVFCVCP